MLDLETTDQHHYPRHTAHPILYLVVRIRLDPEEGLRHADRCLEIGSTELLRDGPRSLPQNRQETVELKEESVWYEGPCTIASRHVLYHSVGCVCRRLSRQCHSRAQSGLLLPLRANRHHLAPGWHSVSSEDGAFDLMRCALGLSFPPGLIQASHDHPASDCDIDHDCKWKAQRRAADLTEALREWSIAVCTPEPRARPPGLYRVSHDFQRVSCLPLPSLTRVRDQPF